MTVVCGDSHTSTHGAFAALAFGIGTSEVEHVLATQCLLLKKSKSMLVRVDGRLPRGVTAKDIVLAIIGRIGTAGGTGHAIEFAGEAIRALSMEGRMTMCNMSIEAGARAGMVAVDDTTIDYLQGTAVRADRASMWDARRRILAHARQRSGRDVRPRRTCSTPRRSSRRSPGARRRRWSSRSTTACPIPTASATASAREGMERALDYMGLAPNTPMTDIRIDKVFIGSCTNSRIEDLRAAASVARGRRVADNVRLAMVVPGSGPREGAGGARRARPRCSATPASNGASPAARCASR